MNRTFRITLLLACSALVACGQKGPLYLPTALAPVATPLTAPQTLPTTLAPSATLPVDSAPAEPKS